jgi:hypothetical protein
VSDDEPKVSSRLFRGYGPLIGFILTMVIVANFLPTQRQKVHTEAVSNANASTQVEGTSETQSTDDATTTTAVDPAAAGTATTAAATGTPTAGGAKSPTASKANPRAAASSDAAAGRVACTDRKIQVPNDAYSPNCFTWPTGSNNGGATSLGVTGSTIKVSVRIDAFLDGLNNALSKAAPGAANLDETPDVVERTFTALAAYFNKNYQFYGRQIQLDMWSGKGDVLQEALGGGQEGAQQDAQHVAKDLGDFADISAVTVPYAEALTNQHVINIGAPYVSKDWLAQHAPYSWTPLTDCTTVVNSVGSYYAAKLGHHNADLAGGDLKGKPRRTGIIAPDNDWYQQCVNAGINTIKAAGFGDDLAVDLKYQLDLNKMLTTAQTLLPQLRAAGVTTVICGCDPVLLSFLTAQAAQQNYFPEWVITGVAYVDEDLVGQLFEPREWAHAFGVSYLGPPQPFKQSFAYNAYKQYGPAGKEPSIAAQMIFDQMQVLAIGIQMAGPNLNPSSFQAGMFGYLPRSGLEGLWDFGPGDFSTSDDAREVYWDPNATSTQNGKKGAYIATSNARFPIGKWPAGAPNVPTPAS